jgi:predicted dehydrogenase
MRMKSKKEYFCINTCGMVNIGVLGTGHLGKIHLRQLREIKGFTITGFYDPDDTNARLVEEEFGIPRFTDADELIHASDALDIVTPTVHHYEYAARAMKSSRHVFIEKPVAHTLSEAKKLVELAQEANVKVQIGHVERFNPAFLSARPYLGQPMFIECHRLAEFNPRGTDVSVVLDLMIHDIDIVLSTVKSRIKRVSASGVAVVSDTPDIANARIEFDNGCVANLTASRLSLKKMRKARFFQRDAYLSIDFLEKKTEIVRLRNITGEPDPLALTIDLGAKGTKQIYFEKPETESVNSIRMELSLFLDSIMHNRETAVTIQDGYDALSVAHQVLEKINTDVAIAL